MEVPDEAPAIDPDEIFADEEGGRLPDPEVNSPEEGLHPGEGRGDDSGLPHGEGDQEEKDSQRDDEKEENGGEDDEKFDIQVYRLAIPIEDRSAEKVLDAVIQLYLQLRADGFQIQQLHTDKAREFVARGLLAWCRNRNIYKTSTSGDSPQQNGRAERAVQYVKGRIRVLLLSAGWKASSWPLACWNIHAMERLRRNQRKMDVPAFGTEVLVRKRYWKSKELEPTHEKVWYVAPIPEVHGHLVVEADGALRVTAYTMAATKEPPENEETWIAIKTEVEDREDELEVRRRIRGKTAIRTVDVQKDEDEEEAWKRSLQQVIHDESVKLVEDEEDVGTVVYKRLRSIKPAEVETEVEEVLRTRIVSVAEFLRDAQEWRPAVEAEMKQLFEEKKALVPTTLTRLQEMKLQGVEIDLIPSKLVITLKPGPRRKVRIVACGNYVEFKGEELYAAGADSAALRLLLKFVAEGAWNLLTADVKVAFLNAPLVTSRRDGTSDAQVFALKPPALLLRLGFAREDEVWVAEKAMYGLRQSPRSWSLHRDKTLQELSIKGLKLRQTTAEQNLWAIEDDSQQLVGMILIYVDDMLVGGRGDVADAVLQAVQGVWETSEPEKIDDGLMSKFLGMELTKKDGILKATQTAFIQERLGANLGEDWERMKGHSTPCGREIIEIEEEQDIKPEEVKDAQRIVGELLWLVTRSRLDLMYVTARLAQWVLRAPRTVQRLSKQVWSYLRKTLHQGLLFLPEPGQGWAGESLKGLEAFSDASFAPGGQHSIGAVIVLWNGAPMMWRAGKQPFPTMSAAELELTEATEAMLMGDAFDALLSDLVQDYPKSLMIDNQAAIQLMTEESGAWRTRHLRLRSSHLRWRISRMDWRVNHCPGERMLADIGTKPLATQRFDDLKVLCGMSEEKGEGQRGVNGMAPTPTTSPTELQQVMRMIAIATLITTADSCDVEDSVMGNLHGRNEGEVYDVNFDYYTIMAVTMAMLVVLASVIQIGKAGRGTTKRMLTAVVLIATGKGVAAPNGDGDDFDERAHGRREEDATMWMMIALYTFVVVIVVNIVQRVFTTWRNFIEASTEEQNEDQKLTPGQKRRIQEAQERLREADEQKNDAEKRLFYAIMEAYHPEELVGRTPSRSLSRYTTPTPESRRMRSRRDHGSESARSSGYERSTPRRSGEEEERRTDEEDRRTNEEDRRTDESQETRQYGSDQEEPRPRFNAFDPSTQEGGAEQAPEDAIMEEEEGERGEHREINLPEYLGPGRYVEDVEDELSRNQEDGLLHDGQQEGEVEPEDPEGDGRDEDLLQDEELSVTSDHEVHVGQHVGPIQRNQGPGEHQEMEPDTEPDANVGGESGLPRAEGEGDLQPPVPEGDLPDHEILITPNGTRYHLSVACPTLANTRRVLRSDWCEYCCRRTPMVRTPQIHVVRPGEEAHLDRNCPHVGLRMPVPFRCCQMCPRRPTTNR